MKHSIILRAIIRLSIVGILAVLSACSGSEEGANTIKAAFLAANAGNYTLAESYLSSFDQQGVAAAKRQQLASFRGVAPESLGPLVNWDTLTVNRTLVDVEIKKLRKLASPMVGYEYEYVTHSKDGSTATGQINSIREGDAWKISFTSWK